MLTARTHGLQRLARSLATAVDTSGVKVAAFDVGQPTSSVTLLVRAGSRFESKDGLANALKNFAFKSTKKRSALGTVRESELYGGVLSSSLSREHLSLTAEFLRQDAPFFIGLLTSFVTSAKFTRHEFQEYVAPLVEAETEAAQSDPATKAVEEAHALAFRRGLGQSLFAPEHNSLTVNDVQSFAASVFANNNISVIGTGIDQDTLNGLVGNGFKAIEPVATLPTVPSKYFGGETRVQSSSGPQTVFIGYGATGGPSAELAALAAHLSPSPSVKWCQALSPLSSLPAGTSAQAVYLPYSDATLVGLLIQSSSAAAAKEAGKAAVAAMKAAANSIKAEDLRSAVAKAKFSAASALESREGLVNSLGSGLLSGSEVSLHATLSSLDKISTSSFTKAVATLISAKPTFIVVGDSRHLPYADELGL